MRSRTTPDLPGRCRRCWVLTAQCICASVPTLATRTRIVVIRHWKEQWKTTNTARLAALALPGLEIVDYGAPGHPINIENLNLKTPWILFPDASGTQRQDWPETLVVLDGTWGQARQMAHRTPGLARLPRLCLTPPPVAPTRLRAPPHPDGMATIEALGHALTLLEGPETGEALLKLHEVYVEAVLKARFGGGGG